jgi:two-component system, chemotaxis family, protein-glutamate methylesterase/glutaminase
MPPVRVLVVDDSVVVRRLLCEALGSIPKIEIAGSASSGEIALAKIPSLRPDIITLDIEMPGLNGIETLVRIRKQYPKLPVIMFSTLTERGASITLEALSLGASDYVTKPTNSESLADSMEYVRRDLAEKILTLSSRGKRPAMSRSLPVPARSAGGQRIDVLAIGVSTGGPNALATVIPELPADLPVPVVIVQHMPPLFTRLLADRLSTHSHIPVREAEAGKNLHPGQAWIAPGDYHMVLTRKGTGVLLNLNQDAPENSCRPAVDVLFRSVAQVYGAHVLAVVLTGMGADGALGAAQIKRAGGEVFVQDEATSVVWGMPGAVVSGGLADKICPLHEISREIVNRISNGRARGNAAPGARRMNAGK